MNSLRVSIVVAVMACVLLPAASARGAFPGENGRIAFTKPTAFGQTEVFSVDPSGDGEVRLTTSGTARDPAWSPDGRRLAFSDGNEIYTSGEYGANRSLVLNWNGAIDGISWSPDGGRLAASLQTCDAEDCHVDVYVVDVATGAATDLTPDIFDERQPSWSPDGSRIAFGTVRAGDFDVYTIAPDGTGLTNITSSTTVRAAEPDWSPDGQKIVFADLDGAAVVANADGSGQTRIPFVHYRYPSWSPDGQELVYSDNGFTVSRGSPGGTVLQRVGAGFAPDWQPAPERPQPSSSASGYPVPKGATPLRVPLVPAYQPCEDINRHHGAPLSFWSCAPPRYVETLVGGAAIIGSPESNGLPGEAVGFVRLDTRRGVPSTPEDEADVLIAVQQTDVWSPGSNADYTGELLAELPLRITDRFNGGGADASATVTDLGLRVVVPCSPTTAATGSTCATSTSADAVGPGLVQENRRGVWQLDRVKVYDGGYDRLASTRGDNVLFATQGVFVP